MTRYHVNPHTGTPGPCKARISCPYGDLERDHFSTFADAQRAFEAGQLDSTFTTLRRTMDEVLDEHMASPQNSDDELLAAIEAAGWARFDPSDLDAPGSPFVTRRVFEEADGVNIETTLTPGRDLKLGQRVWDPDGKQTWTVMTNDEGQRIMRGKAGEDISLEGDGADGLEYRVDRVLRFDQDQYHPGGTDYAALTDEAMHAYEASATAVVSVSTRDTPDGPLHHISVNTGVHTFDVKTPDSRDVVAAQRIADAGEWGYLVANASTDLREKVATVGRYLRKRDAVGYVADAKLDVQDELEALSGLTDEASERRRRELVRDYELLAVAENVMGAEARQAAFQSAGDPPF